MTAMTTRTLTALLTALLLFGLAGDGWAGRVDGELGVGVLMGFESGSNRPTDPGLSYGIGVAGELSERLDFELGFTKAEARDRGEGDLRKIETINLGLRWYPWLTPGAPAALYFAFGGARVSGLELGETRNAYYLGPGMRFQAGESSGFGLRVPMFINAEKDSNGRVMAQLNWFTQFK
ncbi:MAG: hypothetical protein VB852_05780 [Deltaproteobacteria bacterium]